MVAHTPACANLSKLRGGRFVVALANRAPEGVRSANRCLFYALSNQTPGGRQVGQPLARA
jgi:hypothetical protein